MTAAELRILDANANRAREGMRVVEDIARLALDDAGRSAELKELRHRVIRLAVSLSGGGVALSGAREAGSDVGKSPGEHASLPLPGGETTPEGIPDPPRGIPDPPQGIRGLLERNSRRAQEAVRVMEELSRLEEAGTAGQLKEVRFRLYCLESELSCCLAQRSGGKLGELLAGCGRALLYVILDAELLGSRSPGGMARELAAAGADMIQARAKKMQGGEMRKFAAEVLASCREAGALMAVNDRADIARAVGADGVHVGQEDVSVRDARAVLVPGQFVGLSTHCMDEAEAAGRAGADYVAVGPVFTTATKVAAGEPVGTGLLREVAAKVSVPVCAIGGIGALELPGVLDCGCRIVAVGSAVLSASDPAGAVRELAARLREAGGGNGGTRFTGDEN